jgi:hypothetical protein
VSPEVHFIRLKATKNKGSLFAGPTPMLFTQANARERATHFVEMRIVDQFTQKTHRI